VTRVNKESKVSGDRKVHKVFRVHPALPDPGEIKDQKVTLDSKVLQEYVLAVESLY
jgi:hypothetical protein